MCEVGIGYSVSSRIRCAVSAMDEVQLYTAVRICPAKNVCRFVNTQITDIINKCVIKKEYN